MKQKNPFCLLVVATALLVVSRMCASEGALRGRFAVSDKDTVVTDP